MHGGEGLGCNVPAALLLLFFIVHILFFLVYIYNTLQKRMNNTFRAYSRKLGQHSILYRKGTFYEKRAPKTSPPPPPLFNPFSKCFASK